MSAMAPECTYIAVSEFDVMGQVRRVHAVASYAGQLWLGTVCGLAPQPYPPTGNEWAAVAPSQRCSRCAAALDANGWRRMTELELTYVTYVRATPEVLWQALTDPELTCRYWFDVRVESDWRVGSPVTLVGPDGRVWDHGEVLRCVRERRLSYSWITLMPELAGEPASRVTFELESFGPETKLTLTHDQFEPSSRLYLAVRVGWPALLSSLKSLLETGEALAALSQLAATGRLVPASTAHDE